MTEVSVEPSLTIVMVCSGTKVVVAAGIPSAVVTPGAFKYRTGEPVGRVMTVERAGIHKLPVAPSASD